MKKTIYCGLAAYPSLKFAIDTKDESALIIACLDKRDFRIHYNKNKPLIMFEHVSDEVKLKSLTLNKN